MSAKKTKKQFKEMTLDQLGEVLDLTIKHDKENKIVTFLAMLSAYTDSSQINISFNAPSSSGKTYIASEIARLFPKEDKIELSGATPTSLFYFEDDNKDKKDKDDHTRVFNLERKILIFYEMPSAETQARLRAVLSHDQRELKYQMTNKAKSGRNRSETLIIRGFPATIFCSAGQKIDEQETTRAILLSPEVTGEKLLAGIRQQVLMRGDPNAYKLIISTDDKRNELMRRIIAIRELHIDDIVISNALGNKLEKRFHKSVGTLKARHMRDMAHLMELIKAIALLNVWHRLDENDNVQVNQSDIDEAFRLWSYFSKSTMLGISPSLLQFYEKYILPAHEEKFSCGDDESGGITRTELAQYYLKITNSPLNDDYLRKQILPQLMNAGLITQAKPDKGDKRSVHIYPVILGKQENNIGNGGVPLDSELITDKEFLDNIPF